MENHKRIASTMRRSNEGGIMSKKILVVDDDKSVRKSISLMIECMGFEVRDADCGEKAIKLFKENAFHLVLTDFNMPGMDGAALARCIKQISPTTPVVLVTGDAKALINKGSGGDSFDMTLPKPLMLNQIKETIGSILG
jgi:two-component system capsular synthesis sensor histidine kinase RcsC